MREYFYAPEKFRKERDHIRLGRLVRVAGADLGPTRGWNWDGKRKSEDILSGEQCDRVL